MHNIDLEHSIIKNQIRSKLILLVNHFIKYNLNDHNHFNFVLFINK